MSDDTTGTDGAGTNLDISDEDAQALLADSQGDAPATGGDTTDWKAEAEKWKGHARKSEARAKENAQAAHRAKTVEERLSVAEQLIADREAKYLERNGRLALAQVQTLLAEAGLKRDDVAGLFDLIEPSKLLVDGEPDEKAIAKAAAGISKGYGRVTPDPDQGIKGGDTNTLNMNQLIRRAAGFN